MRNLLWIAAIASAALVACGSDTSGSTSTTGSGGAGTTSSATGSTSTSTSTGTGGGGGAGGGGTSTSTSNSSGTASSSASSSSSASGTGGGGPMLINGCDPATAENHEGQKNVNIAFGGLNGFKYVPACIVVSVGTTVTYAGDFLLHPLEPGVPPAVDPASPIKVTSSGMSAMFNLPAAGTFPYYCQNHSGLGMEGAIFVK